MRRSTTLLVLTALLATACESWKPPPARPLHGWEPVEAREEGVRTWVKDSATVDVLDPQPMTPEQARRRLETAENAQQRLHAITGFDDVDQVQVGEVRGHEGIQWVDVRFHAGGAGRRMRIAWYAGAEGLRSFRLTMPAAEWSSDYLSPFHDKIRQLKTAEPAPEVPPGS